MPPRPVFTLSWIPDLVVHGLRPPALNFDSCHSSPQPLSRWHAVSLQPGLQHLKPAMAFPVPSLTKFFWIL
jgi:hypothetical protein